MDDILTSADEMDVGVLWNLPSSLPLADLPAILDAIQTPTSGTGAERRNVREVAAFFQRMLLRVLESADAIDPARLLVWLEKRLAFAEAYSSNDEKLKQALRAHPERLVETLAYFLQSFDPDDRRWLKLSRFREAVFFEIGPDQLITGILTAMAAEPAGSPRELFFYEAALSLSYQAANSQDAFARVYEMANNRTHLTAVRTRSVSSDIPEGRLEMMERREARSDATANACAVTSRGTPRPSRAVRISTACSGRRGSTSEFSTTSIALRRLKPASFPFWATPMRPWPWMVWPLHSNGRMCRRCRM